MNYFLFIFMITLTVATSNPVDDLSSEEIVDLVNNCNSLKEENEKLKEANINLEEISGKYNVMLEKYKKLKEGRNNLKQKFKYTKTSLEERLEEAITKNNHQLYYNEQLHTQLLDTKADLKSSQKELTWTKARVTKLENKIHILTTGSTPAPPLTDEERVAKCGVISSIGNESITASSIAHDDIDWYGPQHSRLYTNTGHGAWLSKFPHKGDWIELDLGTHKHIRGVATQGEYEHRYYCVYTYSIAFKTSTSSSFQYIQDQSGAKKIFQGNNWVPETVVINDVDIEARFIRIYPLTWRYYPTLRFDVLVC